MFEWNDGKKKKKTCEKKFSTVHMLFRSMYAGMHELFSKKCNSIGAKR